LTAITPVSSGTTGYVVPGKGVYGGVTEAGANLLFAIDEHHSNRLGLKMSIYYFESVGNADTWASGIRGIVAVAWQPADADDDAGAPFLSAKETGTIQFQMENAASSGWIWILHSS
jgi:hypothetical protein